MEKDRKIYLESVDNGGRVKYILQNSMTLFTYVEISDSVSKCKSFASSASWYLIFSGWGQNSECGLEAKTWALAYQNSYTASTQKCNFPGKMLGHLCDIHSVLSSSNLDIIDLFQSDLHKTL